ncbi:MAG: hypothetical protein WD044_16940 [Dongiaceae bacterium]
MITYFVTREGQDAIRQKPSVTIGPAADHFEIVLYEEALRRNDWHCGSFIFSDTERLWSSEVTLVSRLWHRLASATAPVHLINHPVRSLKRYGLLRALHESGQNSFDVYRADECRKPRYFPVFLHGERDHKGPVGGLLTDQAALDAALEDLMRRGFPLSLMLITEFCETRSADGLYRKYGVYVIGDRIVPRHLYFSSEWCVKGFRTGIGPNTPESELFAEELAYLHGNPHEKELRKIFELSGIRYGRMDYGMREGRIEVWEINTNPLHMSRDVPPGTPRYDEIFVPFNDWMHAALMELPGAADDEPFWIDPVKPPQEIVVNTRGRSERKIGRRASPPLREQ